MKFKYCLLFFLFTLNGFSQSLMTEDILWSLGRVNGEAISKDGKSLFYSVSRYDKESNKSQTQLYMLGIQGGNSQLVSDAKNYAGNVCFDGGGNLMYSKDGQVFHDLVQRNLGIQNLEYSNLMPSPNGKMIAFSRSVKIDKIKSDYYPDLDKSTAMIFDDLMFRHWKDWEDGSYNHLFIGKLTPDGIQQESDIMPGEPFNAPTSPFGGLDDLSWSADSKWLAYVCVKKKGKDYAISTNSEIYLYNPESNETVNISEGMPGYDKEPRFSPDGRFLAWLSMGRDGYEADKNNLIIMELSSRKKYTLTNSWDETINHYQWSPDSKSIFCNVPYRGSIQLFEMVWDLDLSQNPAIRFRQITKTDHDYNGIIGVVKNELICSRTDMNHAAEIFAVDIQTGQSRALTQVNADVYKLLQLSPIEKHWIKTTDGKDMLSWVIFPPGFDSTKKYPTLLYCQGGPQSALSQFYSFRWNFQLMAAKGYIVVAPNRRGMPGWGSQWNEQISGDWGGQCMKDYLSAIDQISAKRYVDLNRRAAVGASFGGYSVFMLAGLHEKRFKSFVSHCGTYNLESWYASTEELFFANWDLKGPYWDKKNELIYTKQSPHKLINKWDTPIMIIQGGRDYRIPDTQAFEAFTAARLKNLKSRMLYIPDEGHHVLKIQNGLVWQKEFFRWLNETL
ncbi:MAG: S9 family peptidase [Saprospiraceae bacterium]|nr:S9 family peptidase [Saprospiraceae bacterium]